MPIHKELDQGRAETSPTLPLVIHTGKASIFVFESLNFKILKHCWEIYAIYLQAFNSLTTLRWWFHTTVSWYNRLFLAKGTSPVPSFHRFFSTLTHAAFAMSDAHLAVKLFIHLTSGEYFSQDREEEQESAWQRKEQRREEKGALCLGGYLHVL